jgi:hypothetical protein
LNFFSIFSIKLPKTKWHAWRFETQPMEFWEDKERVREYFDYVAENMGIESIDGWYQVTKEAIKQKNLMERFGWKVSNALKFVYSDTTWQLWKFHGETSKPWQDEEQRNLFVHWFEEEFDIIQLKDWYGFTDKQLMSYGGAALLKHSGKAKTLNLN